MFRNKGKSRRPVHNLRLASLLSLVAGIVNVTGFFAVAVLTTDVTGHFAYFADNVIKRDFSGARAFLVYILCYLVGAFLSNTILETGFRLARRYAQAIPVLVEILLLSAVVFPGVDTIHKAATATACILLFAVGLQNATVTRISDGVVNDLLCNAMCI
ncbi:YoaK family protein [Dyadobacter endophyticus]|uniref:YoaK family protein n=1 Tax=Dyadobacter endophyticus TaxID=1749036 RepID=UPI00166576CD|nr:YoaK family protein [Dyadobacter endophyticus]